MALGKSKVADQDFIDPQVGRGPGRTAWQAPVGPLPLSQDAAVFELALLGPPATQKNVTAAASPVGQADDAVLAVLNLLAAVGRNAVGHSGLTPCGTFPRFFGFRAALPTVGRYT